MVENLAFMNDILYKELSINYNYNIIKLRIYLVT